MWVKVNGHAVSYDGSHAVTSRVNQQGELIGFAGNGAQEITIDGRRLVFADQPMAQIAWAPVAAERRVKGGALMQISVSGEGTVRIPAAGLPANVKLVREGPTPDSRGEEIACRRGNGALVFSAGKAQAGRWIYVVQSAALAGDVSSPATVYAHFERAALPVGLSPPRSVRTSLTFLWSVGLRSCRMPAGR